MGNGGGGGGGDRACRAFALLTCRGLRFWGFWSDLSADPVLPLVPEASREARTLLRFPQKLVFDGEAHAKRGRVYVADSGNHRIVAANLKGQLAGLIGSGTAGFADGPSQAARFNLPQGICYDKARHALYVADTRNHAVRVVDLTAQHVSTLVGDGTQGARLVCGVSFSPPFFLLFSLFVSWWWWWCCFRCLFRGGGGGGGVGVVVVLLAWWWCCWRVCLFVSLGINVLSLPHLFVFHSIKQGTTWRGATTGQTSAFSRHGISSCSTPTLFLLHWPGATRYHN